MVALIFIWYPGSKTSKFSHARYSRFNHKINDDEIKGLICSWLLSNCGLS
jgi:hypothetical protein